MKKTTLGGWFLPRHSFKGVESANFEIRNIIYYLISVTKMGHEPSFTQRNTLEIILENHVICLLWNIFLLH